VKNSSLYLIVSRICFVLATVVLLFVAAYVVSAFAQALSPHQVQAADISDLRTEDPLISFSYRLEIEGQSAGYFTGLSGIMMMGARKNVSVIMMDRNYQDVARWEFTNAWPCRITGPSVKSGSNEFGIEEVEFTCEGMTRAGVVPQRSLFTIFWQ